MYETLLPKLTVLAPDQFDMVERFVDHLLMISTMPITEYVEDPTDAELYWAEIAGPGNDGNWQQAAAVPLWDRLAEVQKEPSKYWREIARIKLNLKALGEL